MPKRPKPRPARKPASTRLLLAQLCLAVDAESQAIDRLEKALDDLRCQVAALAAKLS